MKSNVKKTIRRGTLTFEWIAITTLLVIGVISALGALRTALNHTAEVIPENVCNLSSELDVH
ncbi:MAG: hypothetical protein IJK97_11190 [Thermoguttaceae bacterium]|nr:hypothetical protein [Thermoguttaceae bacterium]MBR0192848.1 hypothetical protein [Thermoguttaceae bacterium]